MAEREQTPVAMQAPSDDIWSKCPSCKEMAFRKEVERNLNVCPKCGHHFRITVAQRLSISVDRGTWRELMTEMAIGDPLGFVDSRPYPKRMEQARASSGRNDAVVVGLGKIENRPTAVGLMDFEFMGGSMGVVVGEKVARLFDIAGERKLPVIMFVASGGARMQEGALSLMQMAKVSSAIARYRDARLPYISVLCDPTLGGVAASFAMLGDLNIAEPGAVIGFAGRRVTQQTSNQELPDDFQRAEFLLAHGMLDAIVPRHQMRFTLARLLAMLTKPRGHHGAPSGLGKGKGKRAGQ
jgi:acetyl-CoA carboxylase carboxyl transferase subunit beta